MTGATSPHTDAPASVVAAAWLPEQGVQALKPAVAAISPARQAVHVVAPPAALM